MFNFYAVFMHYLVVYAQFMHVLYDYFSRYIGDILQKTLRTNQKNHRKFDTMFNKLVCHILGHTMGRISDCPYTQYTYIDCKRCSYMYYAYPTVKPG